MSDLIDDYRRHAAAHGTFTLQGEADLGNASHAQLQEAFLALARQGARNKLFDLYSDPDLWVQWWAAAHTLEVDASRALAKLEQLAQTGVPIVASGAQETIKEWQKGALSFFQP
jgi:hypothetical protein